MARQTVLKIAGFLLFFGACDEGERIGRSTAATGESDAGPDDCSEGAFLGGGDGSSGDPYLIEYCCDLQAMENDLDAHYEIVGFPDCTGFDAGDSKGFRPVGTITTPFEGTLQGNGRSISGLAMDRPGDDYLGLFGVTDGATIAEFGLINGTSIEGDDYLGAIIGKAIDTSITHVHANAVIQADNHAGILFGALEDSTVLESYALGNSLCADQLCGYLASEVTGTTTVTDSFAAGGIWDGVPSLYGPSPSVTTESFFDCEYVSACSPSHPTKQSTANMEDPEFFIGQGWNYSTVWGVRTVGLDYPCLLFETGLCEPYVACDSDDTTCDGVDDDCDSSFDEDYASVPTECGEGACADTGSTSCVAGAVVDSCDPGEPTGLDWDCDDIDQDCDGEVDEGYFSVPTRCGIGGCARNGVTSCVDGEEEDSCEAGTPAGSDATCNGVDDDCDEETDEDYSNTSTSCGVAACASTGTLSCAGGVEYDSCVPGVSSLFDTTCNSTDDDCDGAVDEDCCATASCVVQGHSCGYYDNGCGTLLNCGSCTSGQVCAAGGSCTTGLAVEAGPNRSAVWGQTVRVGDDNLYNWANYGSGGSVTCTWDFGDGSTDVVVPNCQGFGNAGADHAFDAPGVYTVTLSATGPSSSTANDTMTITVGKRPTEVVVIGAVETATEGEYDVTARLFDFFDPATSMTGLTVDITYDSTTLSDAADADGEATVVHELPNETVTIDAEFDGDSLYEASETSAALLIDGEDVEKLGEPTAGYEGRRFVLGFPQNTRNLDVEGDGDNLALRLHLSSRTATVATVSAPGASFEVTAAVVPGKTTVVELPNSLRMGVASLGHAEGYSESGRIQDFGIEVTSDDPIAVYGLDLIQQSSDAYLALPVESLGTDYIVLAYPNEKLVHGYTQSGGTQIGIVGTEDGTAVTITPTVDVSPGPDLLSGIDAGETVTITLDENETLLLANQGNSSELTVWEDLSGTIITASSPISVFAGHGCSSVTQAACDHLVEQIPPADTLGRRFLTVPLALRRGGDSYQILATVDDTVVRVDGEELTVLDRGEVRYFELGSQRYSVVEATEPVLLAQFSKGAIADGSLNETGDPFMMLVPPEEQELSTYLVTTAPAFWPPEPGEPLIDRHFLNLVVRGEDIDGVRINDQRIAPVWYAIGDSGWSGAQVEVTRGLTTRVHHVRSDVGIGLRAYGFAKFDSYGYAAGMRMQARACERTLVASGDGADNDCDGRHDEERANGVDDDGDGLIDEDLGEGEPGTNLAPVIFDTSFSIPVSNDDTNIPLQTRSVTLRGFDPNGDPLEYEIVTPPTRGTATVSGRTLTYTSLRYFTVVGGSNYTGGPQTIDVRATDGELYSSTEQVFINVTGEATCDGPTCGNERPEITTNQSWVVNIPGTDPTATLTDRIEAYDANRDPLTYILVTAPSGLDLDSATGDFAWTADRGDVGTHTFIVDVTDGRTTPDRLSRTIQVTVNGSNSRPIFTTEPVTTVFVSESYSYDANAVDAESHSITYSLDTAPTETDVDPVTGIVSGTPEDPGTYSIIVRATDSLGASSIQGYTLTVYGGGPTIVSSPVLLATADVAYRYDAQAVHPNVGEDLNWSLDDPPAGMTIDAASGLIEWTPDAEDVDEHIIRVVVEDESSNEDDQIYTLDVIDRSDAPRITSLARTDARVDALYIYDADAEDPDEGDVLTYELATAPAGMSIFASSGVIQWIPSASGSFPVEVLVRDLADNIDRQAFIVEVRPDLAGPAITLTATKIFLESEEETTLTVTLRGDYDPGSLTLEIDPPGAGSNVPLTLDGDLSADYDSTTSGRHLAIATAEDASGNIATATLALAVEAAGDSTAPVVAITSPEEDDVLTYLHDVIGTVTDANLLRYELALRPVNQPDGWIPIHEAYATVSAAELGEIDTTLLENGYYELRLLAEDVNEQSASTSVRVRVHGDAKIGLVRLSFVDVALEMAGIPLAVVRTYDSRRAALNGDFGYGWQLDLSAGHVQPNRDISDGFAIYTSSAPFSLPCEEVHDQKTHFVEVRVSPQEWYVFRPTIENTEAVTGGCTGEIFFELVDGKFDGASLQVLGNNLVRSTNHGTSSTPPTTPSFLYDEFTSELYDPREFQLVTYDGRVFDLTLERGITRISDFAGNSLFFYPHQIAHTDGRAIHLDRDAHGRIVRVTDPMGHSVRYTYDSRGDLVGVTDLTGGYTQFLYEEPAFDHYLTEIIDPRGNRAAAIDYDSDGRLRATCDAESGCTLAEYDLVAQTQTIEDPTRIPTEYEYDDFGNVIRQTDAFDNDKTFTYDQWGNVLTETDELGNETVYERNRNGQLVSETRPVPPGGDPDDYTTTYTYSPNGPRNSVTYPSGGGYRWLIDARMTESMWGSLEPRRMSDHEGNVLYEREYGFKDILLAHTDRQGRREYEYTFSLVVPSVIHEADGSTTTIATDWNHHPIVIRNGDITARFTYDEAGRPLTEDYGNGVTVNYEYGGRNAEWTAIEGPTFGRYERTFSATGRVIAWTLPNGDSHSRRFDGAGRVAEETGPDGVRTTYEYDEVGRLETQRNEATGAETTFEYDAAGNLTRRIDAEGGETEYTYVAGELVSVEDPLGGVTEYERTPTELTTTDPLDRETIMRLTPLGVTREIEYDDGSTTTTDYLGTSPIDGSNLVTSATDELDRQRTLEYDARGGLISATWPGLPNEWSYDYDRVGLGDIGAEPSVFGADGGPAMAALAGGSTDPYSPIAGGDIWPDMKPSFERILGHRLSSVTTPLGDETVTTFDAQGREETIELPFGETETFTYGADGYLDEHELGDGTTLTFTHDAAGRELTRTDGTESRTITYGPNDRIETVVGPTGTVDYDYDAAGRMTAITTPAGGTVEYAYDLLDRTTEVAVVVGATRLETTYEYDDAGNILSITDPESGVTTYDYDVAGRLETRTLPNGIVSTWTYDDRDRVLSIVHRNPTTSTTLASREYERDLSGAPTRIENEDGTYVLVTYDAGNRVEREEHHAAGGAITRTISYEYDADSNRIGRTLDEVEEEYDHDPGALLMETSVGATPVSTFAYDGQGRTTSITRAGMDYDLEYSGLLSDDGGHVTSIEDGGLPLATYEFDGEGRRERVTHDGVERRYLIAPALGVGLESIHAVLDDEGDLVATYVYEGEHALMRVDANGDITYYLRDSMGTVVGLTDVTATSTATFRYDAFGNLNAVGPEAGLPAETLGDFRFHGAWLDATDLYHARARMYDPRVGRFVTRDPAAGFAGRPETYPPYAYANNNPFAYADPTGRMSMTELQISLVVAAALTLVAIGQQHVLNTRFDTADPGPPRIPELDIYEMLRRLAEAFIALEALGGVQISYAKDRSSRLGDEHQALWSRARDLVRAGLHRTVCEALKAMYNKANARDRRRIRYLEKYLGCSGDRRR